MKQHWIRITVIALLIPFLIYLFLTTYVRFMADDFCDVNRVHSAGYIEAVYGSYQNTNGRFAVYIILLFVKLFSFAPAGLPAFVICALWLFTLAGFLTFIVRRFLLPSYYAIIAALLLILTCLASAPNIVQSFYWQAGVVSYILPLAILCALGWLVLAQRDSLIVWVCCVLLAIVGAGLSEIGTVTQVILLSFALMLRPRERTRIVAALLGTLIGLAILLGSPGNANRRASYPPTDVATSVAQSVAYAAYPLADAVRQAPVQILILIVLPAVIAACSQQMKDTTLDQQQRTEFFLQILILFLAVFAVNFACMFAGFYLTSIPPSPRGLIVPLAVTFGGIMLGSYKLGLLIPAKLRPTVSLARVFVGVMLVVFVVASITQAVQFAPSMIDYAARWDARDSAIRAGVDVADTTSIAAFGLEDTEVGWVLGCIRGYYATR